MTESNHCSHVYANGNRCHSNVHWEGGEKCRQHKGTVMSPAELRRLFASRGSDHQKQGPCEPPGSEP